MNEPSSLPRVPLADSIDRMIQKIGHLIAWSYVLLVLIIITQVVLRKGFSSGLIIFEELQWHLYAVGVMFGLSYAQTTNSHIRVDLFYSHFRAKTKNVIEILSILFMVLPFIAVIFIHSLDFVAESYRINEHSESPSGLPFRWLIKSVIPLSMGLLALAVLSRLYRDTVLLFKGDL
ncbi:TRAP transporter small permease subunit [Amphritea japonica]|uniref:TRAP transporter small permease protein n=1 Tax=Amphritea japonica ATCC BAA-1530 TaxID=1278309 RepID=A0A7R6SRN6_9GAMM|nr:TRAP transporter small permease subunit [Amphritea japonica]BBB25439.1 TRAP dicarboxylate transporter DctQ subunit [Amphritea japonica ATCC BAA-1530]